MKIWGGGGGGGGGGGSYATHFPDPLLSSPIPHIYEICYGQKITRYQGMLARTSNFMLRKELSRHKLCGYRYGLGTFVNFNIADEIHFCGR